MTMKVMVKLTKRPMIHHTGIVNTKKVTSLQQSLNDQGINDQGINDQGINDQGTNPRASVTMMISVNRVTNQQVDIR